jgi:coproporphyrinogen III oxidase-like Fe-S oxidoreductase
VSSEEDEMRKAMMNLYIRQPVDKNEFSKRFGKSPEDAFRTAICKLEKKGLIEANDHEIKLTELGDLWRFNVAWEFGQKRKDKKV